MMIRSDCRGLGRKTPAPKRSMSKREAPVAIISIAQHASPKVIGQSADLRAQLKTKSTVVVMIPLDDSTTSCRSFAIAIIQYSQFETAMLLCPLERSFAPGVVITYHQNAYEQEHLYKPEQRQPVVDHCPRKQKYRLNIENQKQHRYDVKAH